MSFSNLQLDNYFFSEIHIIANPAFNPKEKSRMINMVVKPLFKEHREDPKLFLLDMMVSIGSGRSSKEKFPYIGEIRFHGYFRFEELPKSQKERQKYLELNAMPIAFGIIRSQLAQLTSMSTYGRIVLPVVNFVELIKHKIPIKPKEKNATKKK